MRDRLSLLRKLALPAVAGVCLILTWWIATAPPSHTNTDDPGALDEPAEPEPVEPVIEARSPRPNEEPASAPLAEPARPAPPQPRDEPEPHQPPAQAASPKPLHLPPEGPVEALRRQFESESRPGAAARLEADLQAVFRQPNVSPELLQSFECRRTVCRVEVGWSQALMDDYMIALTGLLPMFELPIAVSPATSPDAEGVYEIALYLRRKAE